MWKKYQSVFIAQRFFVIPTLIFVCVGFLLSAYYPRTQILLYVNSHYNLFFDNVFFYLTYLGDGFYFVVLILALFIFIRRQALLALILFLLPAFVAQVLKRFVFANYTRPSTLIPHDALHIVKNIELDTLHSFPSGHSVVAFSMALFFAIQTKNALLHILYFFIAFFIAYSRMYLAQHFLIDITAGAFIAIVFGTLAIVLVQKKHPSFHSTI